MAPENHPIALIRDDEHDVLYSMPGKDADIQRLFDECRAGVVNPDYKLRVLATSSGDILLVDKRRSKNQTNNVVEIQHFRHRPDR